jgi:broad specificity phosphatase PhoE
VAGLADRLPKSVAAVYTSPLRRAAETAGRIAEAFDLPISEAGADLAPRDVLTDSEMAASSF